MVKLVSKSGMLFVFIRAALSVDVGTTPEPVISIEQPTLTVSMENGTVLQGGSNEHSIEQYESTGDGWSYEVPVDGLGTEPAVTWTLPSTVPGEHYYASFVMPLRPFLTL